MNLTYLAVVSGVVWWLTNGVKAVVLHDFKFTIPTLWYGAIAWGFGYLASFATCNSGVLAKFAGVAQGHACADQMVLALGVGSGAAILHAVLSAWAGAQKTPGPGGLTPRV